jgi:hypothetical protein
VWARLRCWFILGVAAPLAVFAATPSPQEIIQRSVEASDADWKAAPGYNYFERTHEKGETRTYHVFMIDGSPYRKLVAVNGVKLPSDQRADEKRKLREERERRQNESQQQRARRMADFEKDREHEHRLMQEMVSAFDFKLMGETRMGTFMTYELSATPKPDFHPPDTESEVLKGMRGKLWIDQKTFQWVKVEAHVIHPVSLWAFVAKVEPGTRFELEKRPVSGDIWLPSHFSMTSKAKVLELFHRDQHEDDSFWGYTKSGATQSASGAAQSSAR